VTANERSLVTRLQVTTRVFRSNYEFHIIAEGLKVCPFSGGFSYDLRFRRYKALKSPTPYFPTWHVR